MTRKKYNYITTFRMIIQAYKAGFITEEQAQQLIKELNEEKMPIIAKDVWITTRR